MSKFREIPYNPDSHGSFEEEWLCHKKNREWWYTTGYFHDEEGKLYSFQFTMLRIQMFGLKPYIIMLALTDFETGKHHYMQKTTLSEKDIEITPTKLRFSDNAAIEKLKDCMRFKAKYGAFELDLELNYGKGAFWHCDDGKLQMGISGAKETTLYYSYTNMPTTGTMVLNGKEHKVEGKSWFDKQGGSYSIMNRKCMWEWFSLRFFDEEEMMLFSFPQDDFRDGTYIRADGTPERLNGYRIKPLKFTTVSGFKFSCEWKVSMPGKKDEFYHIKPISDGQINLAYFELLADIFDKDGVKKGLCFVELLPGVYNEKINPLNLFKKVD